jgi:hypothetical protein
MKYYSILLVIASLFTASLASAQVQTLDRASQNLVAGSDNLNVPALPSLSVFSHGLLDLNNKVLISAWGGKLTAPASTVTTGVTSIGVQSRAVITSAATIALVPTAWNSAYSLTPAHTATINLTKTNCVIGRQYHFIITTSGTTSYTLTFGTNFKSTGTLATGTTTAKVFVITFVYDGTNLNEVSRTAAM